MPAKKRPTKEFLKDLKKVFEKHNWSGEAIGLRTMAAADSDDICPDGKPPDIVRYYKNGEWVEEKKCR